MLIRHHSSGVSPFDAAITRLEIPVPYPLGTVNAYLLQGPEGVAVIDPGPKTPEAWMALTRGLAAHNLQPSDIDLVLLTHHHPDHYGLSGRLEEYGAAVQLLDVEMQAGHLFWADFEAQQSAFLPFCRQHGMPADALEVQDTELRRQRSHVTPPAHVQSFRDGDLLDAVGVPLRAIWTPGHADGHVIFLHEPEGVVFAGDLVLERITPNIGRWAYSRPHPLQDFLASLNRLCELSPRAALTGHYGALEDPVRRGAELQAHHAGRLDHLQAAVSGRPQDAWQASFLLFPSPLSLEARRFAHAETLAHLDVLVAEGRLQPCQDGARLMYT
ncbi:MBL fold metallo-hydrolase [Deinococcus oregonensis]|uniref:MBL fold metallo-hydrolase n=1 Tax=Deinococcus oregonensis TaxID=1805970 RepID=A0ABV6AW20_9DEIO